MNLDSILTTLETIGHYGNIINTEESIILCNSLVLLQNENHFRQIYLWGKIFGTDGDYYVAYGYIKDALAGRVYYYSINCTDWGLLPQPCDHGKLLTPLCTTKFQGDPAILVDILIDKDETTLGKALSVPIVRQLKEEDRLSATVHFINEEACILPRGALFKRPDGVTAANLNFEGLSGLDSSEIRCFLHYRQPRQKRNTNLLTRVDYNYGLDFLDSIDADVPKGCWSIQAIPESGMVILKSFYWPGMIFYHYIDTPKYGFVYFGHGKKILDLPFMLNSV